MVGVQMQAPTTMKPNDERESSSPTCVFHESFQTFAAALNTGKFPDDTGEMMVEKQALGHYILIVAIDEPGGNRNRIINIKAQHKTRRAAITQVYFKQHLLQKS